MKRILFVLFLIPVLAWGQADSSRHFVKNITFLAGDLGNMGPLIYNTSDEIYDDLRFQAETKIRGTTPTLTTPITLDSLRVDALIEISRWLRTSEYGNTSQFFNRVNNVIKALPNTFLLGEVNRMDADITARNLANRNGTLRRLRGIRL